MWRRRPCRRFWAHGLGQGADICRRACHCPRQRWSRRWNSSGWCCWEAGKTPATQIACHVNDRTTANSKRQDTTAQITPQKNLNLLSLLGYLFIYNLVCRVYPLNANRLPDIQFPLPLKSVQVPELSRVQGCADGVATWTVDRDRWNGSFMTPHPADQLPRVWETHNDTMARFTDNEITWKTGREKQGYHKRRKLCEDVSIRPLSKHLMV